MSRRQRGCTMTSRRRYRACIHPGLRRQSHEHAARSRRSRHAIPVDRRPARRCRSPRGGECRRRPSSRRTAGPRAMKRAPVGGEHVRSRGVLVVLTSPLHRGCDGSGSGPSAPSQIPTGTSRSLHPSRTTRRHNHSRRGSRRGVPRTRRGDPDHGGPRVDPEPSPQASFLAGPITAGVQSLVQQKVEAFLASPAFAQLWVNLNRQVHVKDRPPERGYEQLPNVAVPVGRSNSSRLRRRRDHPAVGAGGVDILGIDVTVPRIPTSLGSSEAIDRLSSALGVSFRPISARHDHER